VVVRDQPVQEHQAGHVLDGIAQAQPGQHQPADARRRPGRDGHEYERTQDAVRHTLDEGQFAAAWAEGRSMMREQAVAYALGPETASR
jgi:hypothetical protein